MPLFPPFSREEFQHRAERARRLMRAAELDVLLVTSEPNFRYLTGFTTQFWVSPTRPWYFVLPLEGTATAVVPSVGYDGFSKESWVPDVRTWPSPRPDDEGVSITAAVLLEAQRRFGRAGIEIGPESRIGIPLQDFFRLQRAVGSLEFSDGAELLHRLRMVKSPAEIERIRRICLLVSDAYEALPGKIGAGDTERDVCRKLHADIILRGADKSPYLIGVSGVGGYSNAIMGPTDRALQAGDVFTIDTGSTLDGYFCDFNRNWAIGHASEKTRVAYDTAYRATDAGLQAVRPGAGASDVWLAQARVLEPAGEVVAGSRMGHGIGLQLTEGPSNRPDDTTVLEPGMVITVEPGIVFGPGQIMLHEEDVLVTENGCELLTRRASRELLTVRL
jgi:Xaa-Pro dipeptidase